MGRLIFNLGEDLTQSRTNIERIEQEVRELSWVVQRLTFEVQRLRENEAHEREILELRLKLELLQSNRQLPVGENDAE